MASGITRIAPTPSGYLHRGNLVHILVVQTIAQRHDLDVLLRIDAFDTPRVRPEYVQDIFRVLTALDVTWHAGPRDARQVAAQWENYDWTAEVAAATERGLATYACACSRRQLLAGHRCTCARDGVSLRPGLSALRLDATGCGVDDALHGTVLWRRDDLPSTHIASVLADRDADISHVIRGMDLAESTRVQRAIAPFFGAHSFSKATFLHHPLIVDLDGTKLAKSANAQAVPLELSARVIAEARSEAALLAGDG